MNCVADILADKGGKVFEIDASATVLDAVKRMVEANVGSLLVTDSGNIAGIVTERDYLRRVTLEGRDENAARVREIMTSPLVYVTPDTTIDECMAVMTDRRIRHVPVIDEADVDEAAVQAETGGPLSVGDVVGVVSIGDVVKFQSKQQSFEIKYLTDYISGR